ncbi:phage baseplate protein [Lactococcus petauri]|uniref:phage baseplate protein n=1 Tax=Lactococcus petauri TaxID=1940789 RepID=UPI0018A8D397|nr:phage baseplate protein [Lactococcus petauri]MDC0826985.1 phage baseplate protein [Lactococcus petauri]
MGQWFFPVADNEGDRTYSDDDFAKYYANFFRTGVFATLGDGLQVLANSTASMNVFLKTGGANLEGRQYYQDADILLQLGVSSALQDRIDGVVLRYSRSTRSIGIYVKTGDITVTRTADVYEVQLAQITVKKNVTSISQKDIKDMRADATVCGFCTPYDELEVGDLMAQFKSELDSHQEMFEVWFQNLKDELDENQAANLQNQINNKANDSEVIHLTGDETITDKKTFTGSLEVQLLSSGGTPLKSAIFDADGQALSTDRGFTPLTMAEGYAANAAEYYIKGGWIFITVQGARPKSNQTGASYYNFLKLPSEIVEHLSHTEAFMWSNFQGGGTAYSGGVLNTGEVQLYASPSSVTIGSNHRYSFNMVIPLRTN